MRENNASCSHTNRPLKDEEFQEHKDSKAKINCFSVINNNNKSNSQSGQDSG